MVANVRIMTEDEYPDIDTPIWFWGEVQDLQTGAFEQAVNLSNHPLIKHIRLMADCHQGYGVPIGGVIALEDCIIPNAVGLDIGCGVYTVKTSLKRDQLTREILGKIISQIYTRVPVGTNHRKESLVFSYSLKVDYKELREDFGSVVAVTDGELDKLGYQLGTLGSGNHFIEFQYDELTNDVYVMIHSGSRNLGKKICEFYHKKAVQLNTMFRSEHPPLDPKRELAFIPRDIPLYNLYLAEMKFAMGFAAASRIRMMAGTLEALDAVLGSSSVVLDAFDCHHNFAQVENWLNKNYMIVRKGAVKADGKVAIPGSMGTASYICQGLNNPHSFGSSSHGAGRVLSRNQANKIITHEQAVESMQDVVYGVRNGQYDEMPAAYKDIEKVIAVQSELIQPLVKLKPLAVVKG